MRRVMLEVLDVRVLEYKTSIFQQAIEVQVKVPMKGVTGGANQWLEPDYAYIRRLLRTDANMDDNTERRWRDLLKGRKVPIPSLEKDAQKLGYKMDKRRGR